MIDMGQANVDVRIFQEIKMTDGIYFWGSDGYRVVVKPEPIRHRWELLGNYSVFTVVMVIYHYVERILRILLTPNFSHNICDHEKILSR